MQADAEQAYVQAELKGPPTWVCLPEELWPDSWYVDGKTRKVPRYRKPVVRLHKALYGHPDSGSYWEMHCDSCLKAVGFETIDSWPSCYWHSRLSLFLSVYVDDFKMAGPERNMAEGWRLIQKYITMEQPQPANLYLGCEHERRTFTLPDGKEVTACVYNMQAYLESALDKYKKEVKKVSNMINLILINIFIIDII